MNISNLSASDPPPPAVAPKSKLNDPNRVEFAKDSTGRMIGAKPIDALDMFELTLLLGPEHSGNQGALNHALMAASVVRIDDREVTRHAAHPQGADQGTRLPRIRRRVPSGRLSKRSRNRPALCSPLCPRQPEHAPG
jgi:hypothetical protein